MRETGRDGGHRQGGERVDPDDLALRFAAGNAGALEEVYAAHGRLVFSLCLTALRHRQDAEDAAQQVFTRAWRSRESFDPSYPVGAWLTGITRRVIADHLDRRRRQQQEAEAEVAEWSRADQPALSDALVDRLTVMDALDLLGPPADEILKLVYTEDLPHREVAERLGMPVGTVKSHVHRGLARLRERLEVRDV